MSTTQNRRRAPRFGTRLRFDAWLLSCGPAGEQVESPVKLSGYTQDISLFGLSIVAPFIHFSYRFLMVEDCTLRIELRLPSKIIEIIAMPIHFRRAGPAGPEGYIVTGPVPSELDETEASYLIGLSIKEISKDDLALYSAYIAGLE